MPCCSVLCGNKFFAGLKAFHEFLVSASDLGYRFTDAGSANGESNEAGNRGDQEFEHEPAARLLCRYSDKRFRRAVCRPVIGSGMESRFVRRVYWRGGNCASVRHSPSPNEMSSARATTTNSLSCGTSFRCAIACWIGTKSMRGGLRATITPSMPIETA